MIEQIKGKGIFKISIFDKEGKLIYTNTGNNLVVDLGRNTISHALGNDNTANRFIQQIGFGENTAGASPADSALSGSAIFKNFDSIDFSDPGTVAFNWSLDYSEGNGLNITEFGMFSNVPEMFAHYVRAVISKTIDIRLVGTWTLIF